MGIGILDCSELCPSTFSAIIGIFERGCQFWENRQCTFRGGEVKQATSVPSSWSSSFALRALFCKDCPCFGPWTVFSMKSFSCTRLFMAQSQWTAYFFSNLNAAAQSVSRYLSLQHDLDKGRPMSNDICHSRRSIRLFLLFAIRCCNIWASELAIHLIAATSQDLGWLLRASDLRKLRPHPPLPGRWVCEGWFFVKTCLCCFQHVAV